MAFWSDIAGTPEPLRQNRWYLQFGDPDPKKNTSLDELRYALMDCGKPEMEITISEHLLLNHYFKYPGLVKWKPINIKFVSTENASKAFYSLIDKSGYKRPGLEQSNHINKTEMNNKIQNIEIIQIDSDANQIEKWVLFNPLISNLKYGTLSYSSEEFVTIEATINYDFAELV